MFVFAMVMSLELDEDSVLWNRLKAATLLSPENTQCMCQTHEKYNKSTTWRRWRDLGPGVARLAV